MGKFSDIVPSGPTPGSTKYSTPSYQLKKHDDVVGPVRAKCREYSLEVVELLMDICRHGSEDSDRIASARLILDRGYGKPHQAVTVRPSDLSDAELRANVWQILQTHQDKLGPGTQSH